MTREDKFAHLEYLRAVLDEDHRYINEKDRSYGASWKKRGGVGAFMMMARKWDRLENMLGAQDFDIFRFIHNQNGSGADGTVLAEVRDLRRYLALVEAEMMARGVVQPPAPSSGINAAGATIRNYTSSGILSDAQEQMRRDMTERRVPRMPPPGTPEDGGHHDPAMAAYLETHTEDGRKKKYPPLLTHIEYEALAYVTIPSGSREGLPWKEIYTRRDDGRWTMMTSLVPEYGGV